jgi:hypothetical protein
MGGFVNHANASAAYLSINKARKEWQVVDLKRLIYLCHSRAVWRVCPRWAALGR